MTFNNYDYEHKRTLVTPHGPDPVLLGIRGEAAESVREAFQMLTVMEPIERWVIFRTNHGTDAHFKDAQRQGPIRTNRPITLTGVVADKPITIRGGHTFFTMKHANETIRCAAFEPTGELRDIAARFLPGDEITVLGGVHQHGDDSQLTINLEKVLVRSLAEDVQPENPVCPHCGKHMKSAGKQQGFRCARCSLAAPLAQKRMKTVPRSLKPGLYMPTPKAHRHLTKPLSRYGVEKNLKNRAPSGVWHKP
jgi:tRNA(Ile2)-agmatinylcytidine synthase